MDFKTAIETCLLKKYYDFKGRASRSEYWYFTLFYCLVSIITNILVAVLPELLGILLSIAVYGGLLLPSIGVGVRRLHDTNKTGWLLLLGIVPLINLVLIYFFVQKSNEGSNKYGTL